MLPNLKPKTLLSLPSRLSLRRPASAASARGRSRYSLGSGDRVLDGNSTLPFATFAEEVTDLKSVLLDHCDELKIEKQNAERAELRDPARCGSRRGSGGCEAACRQ